MNIEAMRDTLAKSMAGSIGFPDVVRSLIAEGVESYRADLVRLEETFYMPGGDSHVEKMDFPQQTIADEFSAAGVVAAIRGSQAGKTKYREFLKLAMDAGTTSYVVFLHGKRCIYFGRNGEFHVEEFPGQP
ncbi:MAG: DUF1398 family protein [Edaphobacter sp.]